MRQGDTEGGLGYEGEEKKNCVWKSKHRASGQKQGRERGRTDDVDKVGERISKVKSNVG